MKKQLARILVALSPLMICVDVTQPSGGCHHTNELTPRLAVQLPPRPTFMAPVAEPQFKAGDDARVAYRRTRGALRNANDRLRASGSWYDGVRQRYSDAPLRW